MARVAGQTEANQDRENVEPVGGPLFKPKATSRMPYFLSPYKIYTQI